MATQVILTFSDGKLEIPVEVQEQMQLKDGAKLRLILTGKDRIVLEPAEASADPMGDWRSLRGILSDHPEHDTGKARAEERAWELEHDERKFGPFPQR
jgi:bifunctional DNA-binding transcriptional regulator/antitoxin component of YhaV-PrlF toxin-antitoxin module